MKNYYLGFFIFISTLCGAQNYSQSSLLEESYDSLIIIYENNVSDTVFAKQIANAYLIKSLIDKDSTKIARAHQRLSLVSEIPEALKHLDTAIYYSKNSVHKEYPAAPHLVKATYLYQIEEYEASLNFAIQGYQYAKIKKNIQQQIVALHQMNEVNEIWGDYEKSLETAFLTKQLLSENKEMNTFSEYNLSTLEGIGICYVRLKKPDSALIYFKKGINEALRVKDTAAYYAFVSRSGTALFEGGNSLAAMDSLNKGDSYREAFINSYFTYYNYYLGRIYQQQGQNNKALMHFKKVDSIFVERQIIYPELPISYNYIVDHYRESKDKEKQLEYLYKLVIVDSLIDVKRSSIKENTAKEYEIPKLLEEKEILIADLEEENKLSDTRMWWILGFLGLSVAGLLYYFNRQQVYKRRFENLMSQQHEPKPKKKELGTVKNDIAEEIVNEILVSLDQFEADKSFLSHEITLNEVAKSFGSNSSYLSKVINIEKGKNFSNYINDLRIAFTIDELKENSTFRKYTIMAIANESGFKSAESFSKTFYKKYGIYPSYYIKQLENK